LLLAKLAQDVCRIAQGIDMVRGKLEDCTVLTERCLRLAEKSIGSGQLEMNVALWRTALKGGLEMFECVVEMSLVLGNQAAQVKNLAMIAFGVADEAVDVVREIESAGMMVFNSLFEKKIEAHG